MFAFFVTVLFNLHILWFVSSCSWFRDGGSKVLHVRDQITTGLNLIDKWMERRCLMLCADKGQKDSLSAFARRLLVDASHQFGEMDAQKVHHVGFLDMAKYGRLGMPDINDMAAWSLRVLKQNEEYSNWS